MTVAAKTPAPTYELSVGKLQGFNTLLRTDDEATSLKNARGCHHSIYLHVGPRKTEKMALRRAEKNAERSHNLKSLRRTG